MLFSCKFYFQMSNHHFSFFIWICTLIFVRLKCQYLHISLSFIAFKPAVIGSTSINIAWQYIFNSTSISIRPKLGRKTRFESLNFGLLYCILLLRLKLLIIVIVITMQYIYNALLYSISRRYSLWFLIMKDMEFTKFGIAHGDFSYADKV